MGWFEEDRRRREAEEFERANRAVFWFAVGAMIVFLLVLAAGGGPRV